MTRRDDLLGCDLFDAFPDNPANPDAVEVRNLRASLTRVIVHGRADRMPRQRYDIRRQDDGFQQRWWLLLNIPVFEEGGRLTMIVHHAQNMTTSAA